jgi:hypothetical protein
MQPTCGACADPLETLVLVGALREAEGGRYEAVAGPA